MKYQSIFSYYLRKICLDMGVVGSSPIAPTKYRKRNQSLQQKSPLTSGHFCLCGMKIMGKLMPGSVRKRTNIYVCAAQCSVVNRQHNV